MKKYRVCRVRNDGVIPCDEVCEMESNLEKEVLREKLSVSGLWEIGIQELPIA